MYTQYYGLRAQPFRLTPDPSYFFSSATHKSALAYMHYGMQQGEGFIVVTGSPGTGKTTLALTLVGDLPRDAMVIGELVTTQLQPEDLLRAIAAEFKLDVNGTKSDLIFRLKEFFTACTRAGKRVMLLVDEAHDLPQVSFEELRMLSNYHNGPQSLLQCILLGQPPLRDLLAQTDMDQFQQRVIAAHNLLPLSLQETRDYILHRLQQAGWHGDPSFTAEAIKLIHQYTQGIPRRINTLCNRLMLYGFIEEKHQINATATNQVYSEWRHELGQTDTAVLLRQPLVPEINFAGISQEHAPVGRAVGADTEPVRVSPVVRTSIKREVTTPITSPAKLSKISKQPQHEATPHSIFADQISQPAYLWNQESKPQSAIHQRPRPSIPWVLPPLAIIAVVMAVVVYSPHNDPNAKINTDITKITSQIQTALAPVIPEATAPIENQSRLAAENRLHPVQTASKHEAMPKPVPKDNSSRSSTPAIETSKPAQDLPDSQDSKPDLIESEFAAMVPQSDSLSPSEPAPQDIATNLDSKTTEPKTKTAILTTPLEAKPPSDPAPHDTSARQSSQSLTTKSSIVTVTPSLATRPKSKPAEHSGPRTVAQHNKSKNAPHRLETRSTLKASAASISIAYAKPRQQPVATVKHTGPVPSKTKAITNTMPISESALSTLLTRFRDAYNNGNLNELAQLFASNAHSDEDESRDAIVRAYQKLFNLTAERNLTIEDLHWQSTGNAVQGKGRFGIKIKEIGRDWQSSYSGRINLRIENREGQALITALNYSYAQ